MKAINLMVNFMVDEIQYTFYLRMKKIKISAWTLGLSISITLETKFYSSISMVNIISKEIRLIAAEKVREGLYIYLINHPTPETQNRVTEKKIREILKEKFDIQVAEKPIQHSIYCKISIQVTILYNIGFHFTREALYRDRLLHAQPHQRNGSSCF
ncbi:hypothetical protein [Candidatus Williamhamiltonella defendens]|uniref:hypothetical protein n=1 Tax=Candidatus Williamhamiltonella defendens TaxID=138072 RepID=UPI00130D945C|nr:hypothetical protein [Candidatus Hamiltonella defensa]